MFHVEHFAKENESEKRTRCSTWNVLKKRMCLRKELVFHVERFEKWIGLRKELVFHVERFEKVNVFEKRTSVPRGTF